MSRTAVPTSLKESLLEGEKVRRLYRRHDSNKSWSPIGWAIIDSDGTPLYTVTDAQVCDVENMYDLLFTQFKNEGDNKKEVKNE